MCRGGWEEEAGVGVIGRWATEDWGRGVWRDRGGNGIGTGSKVWRGIGGCAGREEETGVGITGRKAREVEGWGRGV